MPRLRVSRGTTWQQDSGSSSLVPRQEMGRFSHVEPAATPWSSTNSRAPPVSSAPVRHTGHPQAQYSVRSRPDPGAPKAPESQSTANKKETPAGAFFVPRVSAAVGRSFRHMAPGVLGRGVSRGEEPPGSRTTPLEDYPSHILLDHDGQERANRSDKSCMGPLDFPCITRCAAATPESGSRC
jgi:hypothetical protein